MGAKEEEGGLEASEDEREKGVLGLYATNASRRTKGHASAAPTNNHRFRMDAALFEE